MTCAEFSRFYSDFRDGNDPALAASMRWHATHCATCAQHARTMLISSDVAARCATHTVGHGQEVRPGIAGVLVVAAYATDIGEGGELELHLRSSKKVLPIRIWVPKVIVVGWVIRWLLT